MTWKKHEDDRRHSTRSELNAVREENLYQAVLLRFEKTLGKADYALLNFCLAHARKEYYGYGVDDYGGDPEESDKFVEYEKEAKSLAGTARDAWIAVEGGDIVTNIMRVPRIIERNSND